MSFKKILLVVVVLSTFYSYAQEQVTELKKQSNDEFIQTYFFVDYSLLKIKSTHEEESSTSGFSSFDDHHDIGVHAINLKYIIDLVPSSSMSFFITPSIGYLHGENNNRETGDSGNIDYWDSLSGYSYGAQAGLSYRFISNGLLIAPYVSAGTSNLALKNVLRFEDNTTEFTTYQFEQDLKGTVSELILGIRFTDIAKNYSSHISIVNYKLNVTSVEGDAFQSDTDFILSKNAEFEMDHLTFQIGFGKRF